MTRLATDFKLDNKRSAKIVSAIIVAVFTVTVEKLWKRFGKN